MKPSTRRLASSRPRSDSATRAALYTIATAMTQAKAISTVVKMPMLCANVASKLCSATSRIATPATTGMRFSSA